MKSYGLKLLLAIVCAFILSSAALGYIFSCIYPDMGSCIVGPTKKRNCQEYEHQFSPATDHGSVECSRCHQSVYAGYICRNCDKNAAEIFKKEHSCFISGIGKVIVIPSGLRYRPDKPSNELW